MPPFDYRRPLKSGIVISATHKEHAEQLEKLQELVFPTLAPEERFRAPHYLKHIELFPEGQFVALDGDKVVGMTSTVRLHFDFDHPGHTFADVLQGGWLTSHEPDGPWLYGADVGTHPEHRRKGVARGLYAARQETVRKLGLLGQVTVGMLSGFAAQRGKLNIQDYYKQVEAGSINDPTVSAQRHIGFQLRGLLTNYLNDPVCDNAGACLVLDKSHEVKAE